MIIHTILFYPSGAVWTDDAFNVGRLDPSGAVQVDAENPTRNRKVVGSNGWALASSRRRPAGDRAFHRRRGNPAARQAPTDRLRAKVLEAIRLREGARRVQQAFAAAGGPSAAADAFETRLLKRELPQKLPS
jgi:hypothetical protein